MKPISKKHQLVASLVSALLMSIALALYFHPQSVLTAVQNIGIILGIELVSFIVGRLLTKRPAGRVFVKILVYSLIVAFILTYIWNPQINLGFATNYIFVIVLQLMAYSISYGVVA